MKKIAYIIFIGIIWGVPSCKNPESLYEEYIVPNGLFYPGKALNAAAYSGKERIKISWQNGTDPKVVKARISWNNDTKSVEVDVDPDVEGTSRIIEPMDENTYSFMIRTYDAEGNVSVPVEVFGTVYGETYQRSLVNRSLKTAKDDPDEGLLLEWGEADVTEVGINLTYTDINGNKRTLLVANTETATTILDLKISEPMFYSTMYKPDSTAIDVFDAQTVERMVLPYMGIEEKVLSVDGLVGFWGFNDASDLEKAMVGNDLTTYLRTANNTLGSPSTDGISQVSGFNKRDYAVQTGHASLFFCDHGISATGDDGLVGEYTILWDIKRPASNTSYGALLNTSILNNTDVDIYFAPDGKISAGGPSVNGIVPETWYRVVAVAKAPEYFRLYVNGEKWIDRSTVPDNFKLETGGVLLMADNDADDDTVHVSSLAIFNRAISEAEIISLGGL